MPPDLYAEKIQRSEWVPAPRFAEFKEKYLSKIEKLSHLAADNTEELRNAQSEGAEARLAAELAKADILKANSQYETEKARAIALVHEKESLETNLMTFRSERERLEDSLQKIRKYIVPVELMLRNKASDIAFLEASVKEFFEESGDSRSDAGIRLARPPTHFIRREERQQKFLETLHVLEKSLEAGRENLTIALRE